MYWYFLSGGLSVLWIKVWISSRVKESSAGSSAGGSGSGGGAGGSGSGGGAGGSGSGGGVGGSVSSGLGGSGSGGASISRLIFVRSAITKRAFSLAISRTLSCSGVRSFRPRDLYRSDMFNLREHYFLKPNNTTTLTRHQSYL